ncbi:MAG: hypothetical protein M1834_006535 [Cirrosporium novae-zelandiae]|nr:MAG: hypothetical protein M1834_006535 [Cirrosporium novae-zelandiae]
MAIITSSAVIRSLSLFHISLAFFFLTSPSTVADQSLVFVFGEAMGLPPAPAFDSRSAPTAFLGVLFALLGISDLTATSMHEELSVLYWSAQAPVRSAFFFILAGWMLLSRPMEGSTITSSRGGYKNREFGGELKNNIVFTWAFVEMLIWFWTFITLRDERRQLQVAAEIKRAQEDM